MDTSNANNTDEKVKKSKQHKMYYFGIKKEQIFYLLLADVLYALALNLFYVGNKIAAGGFAGIATVINAFIPIPIGVMVFIMSIPVVIAAWKIKGGAYTVMALATTAVYSLIVDLLSFLPTITDDKVVAVICGGILYGFGGALAIKAHLSSGGTDLLAKCLITKFRTLSIGTLLMMIDGAIVVIAAIAFRDVGAAIYAILAIATCSVIMDLMNKGFNRAQMFYIFANQNLQEISDAILYEMHRGATALKGTGKYSNNEKEILMVVVSPSETHILKEIVNRYDPTAFVILVSANEIIGEGFEDTNLTETVQEKKMLDEMARK
ncbi:MAG: YitT family protein [Firmicutes bacterium]|nr:YitT family protein [Bacillota bacterium]